MHQDDLTTECAFDSQATVLTINSCTEFVGSPSIIHDRTPECHPSSLGMDVWMTSQLSIALIHNLRGSLMRFLFFDILCMGV